tara:strand:+ start:1529 stop:2053 length:525 start_codon:yes stop_codon:yes gene_type:complete
LNKVHRHIPSIINKLDSRVNIFEKRINFYTSRMKKQIDTREHCFMKIFDLRQKIKHINFDIEIMHDPYNRALGTGEENSGIERVILSSKAKVKKLEADICKYQIKVNRADSICLECSNHIDSYTDKCLTYKDQIQHYRRILKDNMFEDDGEYLDREPAIDVEFTVSVEDRKDKK